MNEFTLSHTISESIQDSIMMNTVDALSSVCQEVALSHTHICQRNPMRYNCDSVVGLNPTRVTLLCAKFSLAVRIEQSESVFSGRTVSNIEVNAALDIFNHTYTCLQRKALYIEEYVNLSIVLAKLTGNCICKLCSHLRQLTAALGEKVDNARCVGSIRAAAATWVPPSVASKDILTLFKATDLKTSVHGDFDYDVMAIDKNHCKAVTSDHAESSLTHLRYGHVVWFSSMCRFVFSNTAQTKRSVSNVLFHTKIYINENIPEIVAFKKRKHQLDREEFQETESIGAFRVIMKQFQTFINFRYCFDDFDGAMISKSFLEYTRTEIQQFRDTLIQHMKSVKKSIDERAQHKRENNRRVNDRVMQSKEGKMDSFFLIFYFYLSKALMWSGLVVTESNETESERHVSSSRSGKDTHAEDADINSVNDKQPLAEVQLTVQHDTLANEQQHSVQSEPIYDTHLLEKVDRNTIPDSTNMCHRGGEIEQNAEKCQVSCPLLDPSFDNMTTEFSNQSLESENIFLKKTVAQLQKDFSRMETHCVNMELKYQNQALKDGQHGQILNETSNKAKINKEIEVLEKINIELEHSVAKLLADNEKLHKENEHLKQTYKDLYDSIKTTRVQTKDHNDSLIAQINSKTVENADLKAQIQEKVFANVALKNELRKLKGNSVDTKFAKPSILGKPVLQPPRNQSVVRQPNAFKSERPNFSKPRFASQVDVNNVLSKPVTQHYLPKGRESAFAKPNHMIASSSSRNSSKNMPRFSSNDMVYNYYLEEAKKKTQERDRKSTTSVMPSAKSQNTTKSCKSKPRSNNQTSRVLPTSKSSCPMTTVMPKADHSRNSSPFFDFKHFVCSTCQKNHDVCITKLLKEVNSRAKIQPHKTRNSNKPIEPMRHTHEPSWQIVIGHKFFPNKWVPTGKKFTSSTTKVDCEPLNGSNEDITNPYECNQTLKVSACTLNLSAGTSFNPKKERLKVWFLKRLMSKNQVPRRIHKQEQSPNSAQGVKEQQLQRAYFDDPCHEILHKVYISQGSSSNVHK
ncbi:hypothetical protein Tco_0750395 [Tanacetum coccineum]|uniref:Uncharacterized protein n=1 Tax=Tanacetum coccineum TaxID=301880 RepID=A0ABQ4Z151_9ASTR